MRQLSDGGNVDSLKQRIGRAFDQHQTRGFRQRFLPSVQIIAIDKFGFNTIARKNGRADVPTRTKQRIRRHNAIAGATGRNHGR